MKKSTATYFKIKVIGPAVNKEFSGTTAASGPADPIIIACAVLDGLSKEHKLAGKIQSLRIDISETAQGVADLSVIKIDVARMAERMTDALMTCQGTEINRLVMMSGTWPDNEHAEGGLNRDAVKAQLLKILLEVMP